MGNSQDLAIPGPRDLAETLRKQYPELPEIWEGGPSKNPAAKSMAKRISDDIQNGHEVPLYKMQWFQGYGKACIRRRRTTIIEEEEEGLEFGESGTLKDLTVYLLDSVIKSKKEVITISNDLHKMYQELIATKESEFREYVSKQEERRDDYMQAFVKLFAQDKDKSTDLMAKLYANITKSQQEALNAANTQQSTLFTSVTAILTTSHGLTEKYFNSLSEVIKKLEGHLLEDFVRIVVFPAAPAILSILFKLLRIQLPEGLLETMAKSIKEALTDSDK